MFVSKSKIVFVLLFGLAAISSASVFIKMCTAPPLIIALYRVSIASVFYWSISRYKSGPVLKSFPAGKKKTAMWAGCALAFHFITWISSLRYTSVASSVVLVQTAPVFVAFAGLLFLKEKPSLTSWIGIFIAVIGSSFIGILDFNDNSSSFMGNLLAVAGAIGAAVYLVLGRKLRQHVELFPYVTLVYGASAVILLLATFFLKMTLFHYTSQTLWLLLLIAFIPQIIGHTSINWALKYLSATSVAVIILGEPVGASVLAWIFLGETIGWLKISSALLILTGVAVTLKGEQKEY